MPSIFTEWDILIKGYNEFLHARERLILSYQYIKMLYLPICDTKNTMLNLLQLMQTI